MLASLCVVIAVSSVGGGTLTRRGNDEAVAGDADNAGPMRFALYEEGTPESCAAGCRALIAASGMVTTDTARQFTAFVRDNAIQLPHGGATHGAPVVVLQSDGGSVLGAIDLGRAIRRLGFDTTVGHVAEHRAGATMRYAQIAPHADCQSMCTFVLLSGVQRRVPSEARVLVHQIWLGDRREDAVAASYSAEDLEVVQRDIGSILQYTMDMGGDVDLVQLSLRVPPWEPMHALTREEIRRARLDTADAAIPPAPARGAGTAAGPALPEDDPVPLPASARGWVTATRGGQPVLARTHPLTVEGERIGTFSLLVACGTAPGSFTLTYRELRSGPADRGLPRSLTEVALVLGERLQPLKITSSERQLNGGELESIASGVLPARLVRSLTANGPASVTLETASVGNPRTTIRVGNTGFGPGFHEVEQSCKGAEHAQGDAQGAGP